MSQHKNLRNDTFFVICVNFALQYFPNDKFGYLSKKLSEIERIDQEQFLQEFLVYLSANKKLIDIFSSEINSVIAN